MDKRLLRVYQIEVVRQSKFALIALDDMEESLARDNTDTDRFWYSVQSFLVAAGDVSKLLWPTKEGISGRGLELRRSLGIADTSPLEPRRFRNHYEHFDERMDSWVKNSERHNFADSIIGPPKAVVGLESSDLMRWYDPTIKALTFQGDEYKLVQVIEAIGDVYQKAIEVTEPPINVTGGNIENH